MFANPHTKAAPNTLKQFLVKMQHIYINVSAATRIFIYFDMPDLICFDINYLLLGSLLLAILRNQKTEDGFIFQIKTTIASGCTTGWRIM